MRAELTRARIIISSGEPAGVGPDLVVQIAQRAIDAEIIVVGDPDLLKHRAEQLGLPLSLNEFDETKTTCHRAGRLVLIPVTVATPPIVGRPDPKNAKYVLTLLKTACTFCLDQPKTAIVTAPVQKSVINKAGFAFSGHTEFFASFFNQTTPVMLLANDVLKVALVTTHLPLSEISGVVTKSHLTQVLKIVHRDLGKRFAIHKPRILVCGLNPHAGEDGYLGQEEITIINPTLKLLKEQGLDITGPHPADTAFTPDMLERFDVFVAMYHDQGLPVVKALGFRETVNITLGLPIIRTSVDHGTALTLAGTGKASAASLMQAIHYAITMIISVNQHALESA